jgi:hypothetical protein
MQPATIAHELAHGAFNLLHTFSTPYIAAEGATSNLMDYNQNVELWKHQWKLISDPKNLWFKAWQEEEEGEMVLDTDEYIGFSPDGHIIKERAHNFKGLVSIEPPFVTKFVTEKGTYTWNEVQKVYMLNGEPVKGWDERSVTGKVAVWRRSVNPQCYTLYQFIPVQNYTVNDFENIKLQINALDNKQWKAEYRQEMASPCDELFKKELKSILKGQEVVSYLNEHGFSAHAELVDETGLLVSKNDAEKYDDFVKLTAENKRLQYQDEETLRQYYHSLESYYSTHASASLTTHSDCPDCPKYPIEGDAYWDDAGRNWAVENGKWIDLSEEFIPNTSWKTDIDVQAIHRQYYEHKLKLQETDPLRRSLGYTDKELFEKHLWRSTQFAVVRLLKEQWAEEQVGNQIWIPLYGSLRKAYELSKISETDMMLKTEAAFHTVFGIQDIFLVKAVAIGLFKFTVWAGGKMIGQDIVYLVKDKLVTARLSFILSKEAPLEATTFLKKEGDNIIEIISKPDSRFIKYDLETGQTLISRYSDDAARTLELSYEDFQKITINTAGKSEDDIVKAVVSVAKGESLLDDIFNLQKSVVNQNKNIIANASNNAKGAFGEIASDAYLTEKGFNPLHSRKTALTDGWGETGIDGVFVKDGQYYIVEAKYHGQATLSTLSDGTKQMSDDWISQNNYKRLTDAVGNTHAQDIRDVGYKRLLAETAPDGTIVYKELNANANVIGIFTP